MSANYLYEYAVIRLVPQVEREEFLNVGVVLFCPGQRFLQARYKLDTHRLSAFSTVLDIGELQVFLSAFQAICTGEANGGVIGKLPIADRFRWLTAARSTVLQTSKVHIGFCRDAGDTLETLYNKLVI